MMLALSFRGVPVDWTLNPIGLRGVELAGGVRVDRRAGKSLRHGSRGQTEVAHSSYHTFTYTHTHQFTQQKVRLRQSWR